MFEIVILFDLTYGTNWKFFLLLTSSTNDNYSQIYWRVWWVGSKVNMQDRAKVLARLYKQSSLQGTTDPAWQENEITAGTKVKPNRAGSKVDFLSGWHGNVSFDVFEIPRIHTVDSKFASIYRHILCQNENNLLLSPSGQFRMCIRRITWDTLQLCSCW